MQDTTTTSCTRDFKVICNMVANRPPVDGAKIRATADGIDGTPGTTTTSRRHYKQVRHATILQSRREWLRTFNWPSLRLNTGMWLYVEPVRYRSRGE